MEPVQVLKISPSVVMNTVVGIALTLKSRTNSFRRLCSLPDRLHRESLTACLRLLANPSPSELAHIDPKQQDLLSVFFVEVLQLGHFRPARGTEAGPEVQDNGLAFEFSQPQFVFAQSLLSLK